MQPYFIALGFIVIDIVTGFCKAFYSGSFNSTVMREGGFHKLSEVFAMIFAHFIEYACSQIDLGIDVPIANAIIVYLCINYGYNNLWTLTYEN